MLASSDVASVQILWSPTLESTCAAFRIFQSEPDWQIEGSNTDEYILCSILWKEIDLDHKLTIIEHLQVQKIYLLDAHIFCEIHCPSLGKIDNIK